MMAESLLANMKTDKISRIDVNFEIPQKFFKSFFFLLLNLTIFFKRTFENMIGRAAHIQFLESQPLMRMLVHCFDKFFT